MPSLQPEPEIVDVPLCNDLFMDIHDTIRTGTVRAIAIEGLTSGLHAGSEMALRYALQIGADDPEDFEPQRGDPGFIAFVEEQADELIDEEIETLAGGTSEEDGGLVIYRSIVVDPDWLEEEHDPASYGLCWSWDQDYAIAHKAASPGDGAIEVRIRAVADFKDVDWDMTIGLAAAAEHVTGRENEIRMRPEAGVRNVTFETRPYASNGRFEPVEVHGPRP